MILLQKGLFQAALNSSLWPCHVARVWENYQKYFLLLTYNIIDLIICQRKESHCTLSWRRKAEEPAITWHVRAESRLSFRAPPWHPSSVAHVICSLTSPIYWINRMFHQHSKLKCFEYSEGTEAFWSHQRAVNKVISPVSPYPLTHSLCTLQATWESGREGRAGGQVKWRNKWDSQAKKKQQDNPTHRSCPAHQLPEATSSESAQPTCTHGSGEKQSGSLLGSRQAPNCFVWFS